MLASQTASQPKGNSQGQLLAKPRKLRSPVQSKKSQRTRQQRGTALVRMDGGYQQYQPIEIRNRTHLPFQWLTPLSWPQTLPLPRRRKGTRWKRPKLLGEPDQRIGAGRNRSCHSPTLHLGVFFGRSPQIPWVSCWFPFKTIQEGIPSEKRKRPLAAYPKVGFKPKVGFSGTSTSNIMPHCARPLKDSTCTGAQVHLREALDPKPAIIERNTSGLERSVLTRHTVLYPQQCVHAMQAAKLVAFVYCRSWKGGMRGLINIPSPK